MSFKLSKLTTLSSLVPKDSLLSLYSPPKNARNPWVETWSFWWSLTMPTFWTTLKQTTFFVVRLLIVSSAIHANRTITWLIGQKQKQNYNWSKFLQCWSRVKKCPFLVQNEYSLWWNNDALLWSLGLIDKKSKCVYTNIVANVKFSTIVPWLPYIN